MAATTKKPSTRSNTRAAAASKKPEGRATSKRAPNAQPAARQARSRSRPSKRGAATNKRSTPAAPETTEQAVERVLSALLITPRRAVAAATVRRLAKALDLADPGDVAKVSRELAVRMAELLVEVEPDGGADKDWTEGSGSASVRDTSESGPADSGS